MYQEEFSSLTVTFHIRACTAISRSLHCSHGEQLETEGSFTVAVQLWQVQYVQLGATLLQASVAEM